MLNGFLLKPQNQTFLRTAKPYTGANTHKSKIPLKMRKYAFSAIAQFLGLIIQYGRPHGKNVNKHGRPHGKNVNKHSRLLEKLKTILFCNLSLFNATFSIFLLI